MVATIQKWGNSQAVRLPKTLLESLNMGENDQVKILSRDDEIVIKKIRRHRTLKERLEGFDEDYSGAEWDTGTPVGREVW